MTHCQKDTEEYDEIPSLYRTFADIDEHGSWVYWKKNANEKWVWDPEWIPTITNNQGDIVVEYDEPLSLHRRYANLDPYGHWDYWKQLENKKWIFNPTWVPGDMK